MKILIISNSPLLTHQGSGYVIVNVSQGLKERGHDVELVGPDRYEPFKSIKTGRTYKIAIAMLLLLLKKAVQRQKFDVVVFYGAEAWLSLLFFKRILKSSSLMVSNSNGLETRYLDEMERAFGYISYDHKPSKWYITDPRNLFAKAFKWSDGIISNNKLDVDFSIRQGYQKPGRAVYINLGIDESFFQVTPDFSDRKTIGYCGSWIRRKGTEFIKPAINRFLSEFPDYRFILVGVGHEFDKRTEFDERVTSRIDVYPEVKDKNELIGIYRRMSISILPSIYESFGLVAAEAMACGAALIASNSGFASSLSRDEAVVLYQLNADSLYQAIKRLATDEQLRGSIARKGYSKSQQLHWSVAIKEIETTYYSWQVHK